MTTNVEIDGLNGKGLKLFKEVWEKSELWNENYRLAISCFR